MMRRRRHLKMERMTRKRRKTMVHRKTLRSNLAEVFAQIEKSSQCTWEVQAVTLEGLSGNSSVWSMESILMVGYETLKDAKVIQTSLRRTSSIAIKPLARWCPGVYS